MEVLEKPPTQAGFDSDECPKDVADRGKKGSLTCRDLGLWGLGVSRRTAAWLCEGMPASEICGRPVGADATVCQYRVEFERNTDGPDDESIKVIRECGTCLRHVERE